VSNVNKDCRTYSLKVGLAVTRIKRLFIVVVYYVIYNLLNESAHRMRLISTLYVSVLYM
jgi:hypothetical protein